MSTTEADHAAIRQVGKATVVLKFFAVGLVVVLGFIYYDISNRYTAMQSGIRENAMWSVYQLDREARSLNTQLSVMLATNNLGMSEQKKLSTRYDILYSRMDMLAKAKFEQYFAVDSSVAKQLAAVQNSVFGNVGIFDDIAKGVPASPASLRIANASFGDIIRNTEQLVTYTNNTLSTDRADQRQVVAALEMKSLILIGLLGMIVGAVVLLLMRQLKSVRTAGLSFERMAGDLENAYQAADAGNRAKSQFMATMSHEIRTPLNAILGTVECMELSERRPEIMHDLKTIQKSGEALLDIINEILDFSKIEHGKLEIEMRSVDVRAISEGVVEMMRGKAVDSRNRIILDIPAELESPFVQTDATRLRQVILNLMSNAVKFTIDGSVTLAVRERLVGQKLSLRVEVRDTGIGIDEKGRSKLFLPFSQVDASIARKYGGTGLGLTICKEIVERLGGTIGVNSVIGSGSTFWFEIPVDRAEPITSSQSSLTEAKTQLPCLQILLVEDNEVNRTVATKFLAHLNQKVYWAENGAVAVEMAALEWFDLILMDMQMPVMDGIEAAQRIRCEGGMSSNTSIVAMTANASEDDKRKCAEAGMDGFQSKPISVAKLRQIIIDTKGAQGFDASTDQYDDPSQVSQELAGDATRLDFSAFDERRAELVEVLGEEDFRELLDAFMDDAASALSDLEKELESGDTGKIDRLLHTIKGAAGNIGLQPVAAMAQDLRVGELQTGSLQALNDLVGRYATALQDRDPKSSAQSDRAA